MAFLGRGGDEPQQRPQKTITGHAQSDPEWNVGLQRRLRLFFQCVRILSTDPLTQPSAIGTPIGDGTGIEAMVNKVAPVFALERSLLRWVALRGALTIMFINTLDSESRILPFSPSVEVAMGVGFVPGDDGRDEVIDVGPLWADKLTPDQKNAAIGLFSSFGFRLHDYARYSEMSMPDVNVDPRCHINDAMALDFIVWASVALLRMNLANPYLDTPEPDALTVPGWYTEPNFAKSERYWNGQDWSGDCRVRSGRRYVTVQMPLR